MSKFWIIITVTSFFLKLVTLKKKKKGKKGICPFIALSLIPVPNTVVLNKNVIACTDASVSIKCDLGSSLSQCRGIKSVY